MKTVLTGIFLAICLMSTSALANETSKKVFLGTDSVTYESNEMRYCPIFFKTDKSTLEDSELEKIVAIAKDITENGYKIIVTGRADKRGRRVYNLNLADKRAESVKSRLVELGVNEKNIIAVTYGEEKPLAPNDKILGHLRANRRVEVIAVKPIIRTVYKTKLKRNRVSVYGGIAPQGLNQADISPTTVSVTQNYDAAFGVGYSRLVTERFSVGAVMFSNLSGFVNVGFDF